MKVVRHLSDTSKTHYRTTSTLLCAPLKVFCISVQTNDPFILHPINYPMHIMYANPSNLQISRYLFSNTKGNTSFRLLIFFILVRSLLLDITSRIKLALRAECTEGIRQLDQSCFPMTKTFLSFECSGNLILQIATNLVYKIFSLAFK